MTQPINKPRVIETKKPDEYAREQLRKQLVEMIRRNEELRREKPR